MTPGRRGGTPDQARAYRQKGHDDALRFATLLGLNEDYKNDLQAKKDVIDPSGDSHSVKAGQKKWQIFLYRQSRFEEDPGFHALNGIGSLIISCIDSFPLRREDYVNNKRVFKEKLRIPMRKIKDSFQSKKVLSAFLMKSIFNGGEVNYLTILNNDKFHVYRNEDIVRVLAEAFSVENSRARTPDQMSEQKVLFKYKKHNVGELEMRNDSKTHYREVRFNMLKDKFILLLDDFFPYGCDSSAIKEYSPEIITYGKATKTFGNWRS